LRKIQRKIEKHQEKKNTEKKKNPRIVTALSSSRNGEKELQKQMKC